MNSESLTEKIFLYTHWRSKAHYYYCIRKTRLVKVFFQFRFQYTQCFIVKFFFHTIKPFSSKYEVTLCIKKYAILCTHKKTSFSLTHEFFSAFLCDTHVEENELYWKLVLFISVFLVSWMTRLSFGWTMLLLVFFCDWVTFLSLSLLIASHSFNIFSTHNLLFQFQLFFLCFFLQCA